MSQPEPPPACPEAPDTPERVGIYQVTGRLGRGGMGEVLLGYDARLDRRVAIKRIRHDAGASGRQRERLRREARAVARLNHPAIVQVHDLVEDPSGDCLVLEFVEGRTLRDLLRSGPLPAREALRLAREIAEGLAAAHEAGIVHRDLKAENVIVTPAGRAKILDFGLAKPFAMLAGGLVETASPAGRAGRQETLTEQGTVLGTSHAMSPEQARGGEVDARSDLFSFGALLYEMLTGILPFRGASILETLQRVVSAAPPPLLALRPGLPPALGALVARLLAKDPAGRPPSAAAVAQELADLASQVGPEPAHRTRLAAPDLSELPDGGLSDLPTAASGPFGALRAAAPPAAPAAGAARRPAVAPAPRRWWPGLVLLALGALAAAGAYWTARGAGGPLRVAVLAPQVHAGAGAISATGPDREQLDLAASGVLSAALASLAAVEGLAALDPAQLSGVEGPPTALARAAAADELFVTEVARAGPLCRVTLRRLQGEDGRVLWVESFDVPAGDLRLAADAVHAHLRRAYPDRPLRPGTPNLEVRDADYAAFLAVRRRADLGTSPLAPELPRLEAILAGSPRFLEAWLQAARIAYSLHRSTRDPAHLERAARYVEAAGRLAPSDPRPLAEGFRIALAQGREAEAEAALDRLDRLAPGDVEGRVLRAALAEHRGQMDEAVAGLAAAAERVPSWRNLYRLADLELRTGRIAESRRHLAALLDRSPGNLWGTEKLAELELMAGDLTQAERLYRNLLRRAPARSHSTNLGLARALRGRPDLAVAAYRQALALDPGHATVLVNLADAELARGRAAQARAAYGQALAVLEARAAENPAGALDLMLRAQCLARLGRRREAVALTQEALALAPDNPEILYLASLVQALAGQPAAALVLAESALRQGLQPRWFALHPLRDAPELRALWKG